MLLAGSKNEQAAVTNLAKAEDVLPDWTLFSILVGFSRLLQRVARREPPVPMLLAVVSLQGK